MAWRHGSRAAGQQPEPITQTGIQLLGLSERVRTAASSIASGMPSSRRQILATAGAFSEVSSKPGLTSSARSTNNRTASAFRISTKSGESTMASGGTPKVTSPATPSGSREVARTVSSR
jgi:hypothetical protein